MLRGKDSAASYHLAVVVDDALQGVSDVVRGRDLFAATSAHRLLQALLDLPAPRYRHHRLVLDADGVEIVKKRERDAAARAARQGVSAHELRVALGFAPGEARSRRAAQLSLAASEEAAGVAAGAALAALGAWAINWSMRSRSRLKATEHLAVELARARELDRHRVDEIAVDDDFVVEVRAGREARLAEIADHLALRDVHARRRCRARNPTCDCRS